MKVVVIIVVDVVAVFDVDSEIVIVIGIVQFVLRVVVRLVMKITILRC